ncbi:MAG: L,D-transpeptidase family protein [Tatlockia sp.]|nr:L,D-transpeptidase family protein [Tatlockia sp.]
MQQGLYPVINRKSPILTRIMTFHVSPLYTMYEIQESDNEHIGDIPKTLTKQEKNKKMPYTSNAEMVAERFHVDVDFLSKLNPDKNMKNLQPGDQLKVPNVQPFKIKELEKGEKAQKQPKFSARKIKISTSDRMLMLYEEEKLLAAFPITPGSKNLPAPKGVWKLQSITYLPWFRYDKKMLKEGKRSKDYYNIPPGPNNLVGIIWMNLNKRGIGIHGSNEPETVGRSTSHGCIRLSNWDAMKLSKIVTPGIKVYIDNDKDSIAQ